MELDEALEAAVPLGRVQYMLVFATMLMNIETGFTTLGNVFLAKIPPHHCANHSGLTLNESVPVIDGSYAQCEEYIDPFINTDTRPCSNGVTFNIEETGHSVVSDWELVCNRDFLPGLSQSLLLAGFGVGSLVGGPLADKYGRRPIVLISLTLFSVLGLSVSLVKNFALFVTLRFLMGAIFKFDSFSFKLDTVAFVFIVYQTRGADEVLSFSPSLLKTKPETRQPKRGCSPRGATQAVVYRFTRWSVGLRPFYKKPRLNDAGFALEAGLSPSSWLIPESTRWLLSQNKTEEAERTMQKIASMNHAKGFPSPVFAQQSENGKASSELHPKKSLPSKETCEGIKTFTQLLKQPAITVTLVLSWTMITGALTYFGFALTTGMLAGNPYLNFFISSLADLFALTIAVFTIKRIGGLITLIFGMSGAAVAMIGIIILPYVTDNLDLLKSLLTVFAISGRFCSALVWQPIILLTSDLFPTSIRNSGTAIVHLLGNFGSLSSPLVIYLNKFYRNLSFMIMVVCCILSVVLSLLLPETLNTTQPETLEDLQVLFDTKRLIRFGRKNRNQQTSKQEEMGMEKSDGAKSNN